MPEIGFDTVNNYSYLLSLQDINQTKINDAGGKAANLGELFKIEGIWVPEGFCITTKAYKSITENHAELDERLSQLSLLTVNNRGEIAELCREIRRLIEGLAIPEQIDKELGAWLSRFDDKEAWAVRSSATAEDLPTASFAGQQDTYLNIIGKESVLQHINKCWASLFTGRAVTYRIQNGFDHRKVSLSVIIQKMIFPEVSGIMFTADPVTSNRKVLSIDAGFGLGEAMVSGIVSADNYQVRENRIIVKKISAKNRVVYPLAGGGTNERETAPGNRDKQALTDGQILQLENTGRKIEAYFGSPQDIEWCLADGIFYIVQSRQITTLFPIPEEKDKDNHVYVSVGHQQMMTDAMKPLGLSFWLLTTHPSMRTAGGRLFFDVTSMLASPEGRDTLINVSLGKSDPLIKDALISLIEREDFISSLPGSRKETVKDNGHKEIPAKDYRILNEYDPEIVSQLIKNSEASIAVLKQTIEKQSGTELFDFILENSRQFTKAAAESDSFGVIMTGMNAASWLNEKMNEWLGEKNAADTLTQSAPNNITSEMGLDLLDVADVIRPYPEVIGYLQQVKGDDFLNELQQFNGGTEAKNAIEFYLKKYGMRCAGEIDITRIRWSEKPGVLVPMILNHIKTFEPGESKRKFEQGLNEALKKEKELLNRLRQLPHGEEKAGETKRMIDLVRNLAGYREYPKYGIVNRYFVYKKALMKEAEKLVREGIIEDKEDICYLTYEEFREVTGSRKIEYKTINKRKAAFKVFEKLTPPRVITSDGEIIIGKYNQENLPEKAIAGLAVSTGIIEGRARVLPNMEDAELNDGDILVTAFTDPSWTPLFVSIKGLVTEVGGLMTHGAVIAREYGLPAVVGVENATKLISDGQRIRVNGTEGYVEILK